MTDEYALQEGANPFYDLFIRDSKQQQRETALSVVKELQEKVHVLLYAPTQSGKTGTMLSTAFFSQMSCYDLNIDAKNIYVITGLSSTEWKVQTQKRFPALVHANILHGPNLYVTPDKYGKPRGEQLIEKLDGQKNVLIMIDEMHMREKRPNPRQVHEKVQLQGSSSLLTTTSSSGHFCYT